MQADLTAYLARHTPLAHEEAVWADGRQLLHLTTYLSDEGPPLAYVTSVRSLVFGGAGLLVLRNRHSTHIVPGGRREPGERLEATLRREVLEETGWTFADPYLLGFIHFQNRSPQLPEWAYMPYPDFIQVVYMAEAASWAPKARVADEYEEEAGFRPLAEVQALDLSPSERVFLAAALARRAGSKQP